VPHALEDFLEDENIRFRDAATASKGSMLTYYDIIILGAHDLQRVIANLTSNYPPALYALSNAYITTNLSKKGSYFIGRDRWSDYPLRTDKIKYAALDARLGSEIARRCWQLVGYKSFKSRLNVFVE
jgi:hypothetical protein